MDPSRSPLSLLVVLILLAAMVQTQAASKTSASAKADLLRRRAMASPDYVIRFDSKDFQKFIKGGQRAYDVVILFSADNCKPCKEVEQEFIISAQHYKEKQGHYTLRNKEGNLQRPVFFAIIKNTPNTYKILREFQFSTLPNILLSTPQENNFDDDLEKQIYQRGYLWQIQASDGMITARKLLPWINSRTKRAIKFKESIYTFLYVFAVMTVALGALLLVYTYFKWIVLHPLLWVIVFYFIEFVSLSGTMYCTLNGCQWAGKDRDTGEILYINKKTRHQYVSEGLLMATAMLSVSLLLILFISLPKLRLNAILENFAYFGCLWLVYFAVTNIETVFKTKNAYYPNFLPPANYQRGSLSHDQGKSLQSPLEKEEAQSN